MIWFQYEAGASFRALQRLLRVSVQASRWMPIRRLEAEYAKARLELHIQCEAREHQQDVNLVLSCRQKKKKVEESRKESKQI